MVQTQMKQLLRGHPWGVRRGHKEGFLIQFPIFQAVASILVLFVVLSISAPLMLLTWRRMLL